MIRQSPSIAYPKNHFYSFAGSIPVKYLLYIAGQAVAGQGLIEPAKAGDFNRLEPVSSPESKAGNNDDPVSHPWSVHCDQLQLATGEYEKTGKHGSSQSPLCDPVRNYGFVTQLKCESVNNLIFINYLDEYLGRVAQRANCCVLAMSSWLTRRLRVSTGMCKLVG